MALLREIRTEGARRCVQGVAKGATRPPMILSEEQENLLEEVLLQWTAVSYMHDRK